MFPSDSIDLEAFFTGVNEIENYPLLHLQTAEGFFTAIDSRVTRPTQNLGGSKLSEKVLLPQFLIRGSVLLREHELGVTDATVRFWDQDEWAQWSSWKVKNATEEDPDVTIVQMARPTVTAIVNGATISLKDQSPRAYFPIGNGEVTMRQSCVFRLTFDSEIPLKDFMRDWLRPLAFLISSGSRQTSGIDSLSIHNRGWLSDRDGRLLVDTWLEVIASNPERRPPQQGHAYLHRLRDFDFERQLQTVFDTFQAHGAAIDQYLDFIHNRPSTPMVRLTLLAQLVETFDRSLNVDAPLTREVECSAKEVEKLLKTREQLRSYASTAERAVRESIRPTLSHRLSRLDRQTGKLVSDALGSGKWKSDVPAVRNAVIHGLPSAKFLTTKVIPLQVAEEILNLLFEARMLLALGFETDGVKKVLIENDSGWWGRRSDIVTYLDTFAEFAAYGRGTSGGPDA